MPLTLAVERLIPIYTAHFEADVKLLSYDILTDIVRHLMTMFLIGDNRDPVTAYNHLFGLSIALQLKPLPVIGRGFFWPEGIGQ